MLKTHVKLTDLSKEFGEFVCLMDVISCAKCYGCWLIHVDFVESNVDHCHVNETSLLLCCLNCRAACDAEMTIVLLITEAFLVNSVYRIICLFGFQFVASRIINNFVKFGEIWKKN